MGLGERLLPLCRQRQSARFCMECAADAQNVSAASVGALAPQLESCSSKVAAGSAQVVASESLNF